MAATKYIDRTIPTISLRDFSSRTNEITQQLVDAAENDGFFTVVDHDIAPETVALMFEQSARFFNQADEIKEKVPFSPMHNAGWEKNKQVRPSTGAVDRKESYQMQFGSGMEGEFVCRFQSSCGAQRINRMYLGVSFRLKYIVQ